VWANYEGLGVRAREGTTHSLHLVEIETVRNEDGNAPCGNGGILGGVVHLREWFTGFPMIIPSGLVRNGTADVRRDFFGHLKVDAIENLRVRFVYNWVVTVIEFKRDGVDDMFLLVGCQRIEEELRLVIVLLEFLPTDSFLYTLNLGRMTTTKLTQSLGVGDNSRIVSTSFRRHWWEDLLPIGPIIHSACSDTMSHLPVTLMIENWANWSIDGKLLLVESPSNYRHILMNIPLASSRPDGKAGCQGRKNYALEEGDHR